MHTEQEEAAEDFLLVKVRMRGKDITMRKQPQLDSKETSNRVSYSL
jgi:hypothetical protein